MRTLLLVTFLSATALASAQELELVTRYDYYAEHDSSATLLMFGTATDDVRSLLVADGAPSELQPYADARRYDFDISDKGQGVHTVPFRADLADGGSIQGHLELRKLPDKPNSVRVDRQTGGLVVDDLPFFPFGFYAGFPVGDLPVQEAYNAMNLVGVYQSNEEETLAERKAYMDLCAAVGMKVNYSVNGLVGTPHNRADAVISDDEEERRWSLLRREVETFRDHPALLAWYMNDEPIGQSRSPELLEKAYRIIKEADPYHPVSVVFVVPDRAAPFMNTLDIAMTDPYPVPGDVDQVRGHVRALRSHFGFRKAIWLVPQAFGGGEFWSREPTGAEINVMTWIGIEAGARGVQYFIRRPPNLFPKSRLAWHEAVRAAHEVSMILPWLLSDDSQESLSTGSERLRAKAVHNDGSILVLAVNTENAPGRLAVDIPVLDPNKGVELAVPFENRSIVAPDGRLTESLPAYGVRVYLYEPAREGPDDLSRHNLFPNPSFEWTPNPGVPAGAYADSKNRPDYDGSTYFVDSRVSHSGRNALRFNSVSDSSHLALTFHRMYVEKGRLYHASLWSRHGEHDEPASFMASIPGLELERSYVTRKSWQNHSFYFKATEQTTFAQLRLETSGAGTFWVDDVVVAPDPTVDVAVLDGPRAQVRIRSANPDVAISFSLPGESTRHPYVEPIELTDFTELDLFVETPGLPVETMAMTVPLSRATRRAVTFSTPYHAKYSASGDGTVLDGEYGSLAFRDGKYLGFDGKNVEFTIDLEEGTAVSTVTPHFLVSVDDGIHAPLSVEAWTSADGDDWLHLGRAENPEGSKHGEPYHLDVPVDGSSRDARFVRVVVGSPIVISNEFLFGGTDAWIFIDEVLVDGPR
jgi:hypothetical protein